jgi:hypothetical protein
MTDLHNNPQYQSMILAAQYSKLFGHGVPMAVLQSNVSTEDLIVQLNAAIASGKPVPEWSEAPITSISPPRPAPTMDEQETEVLNILEREVAMRTPSKELLAKQARLLQQLQVDALDESPEGKA